MATVELDEREWNQIMTMLSNAPWNIANPLLMRIGQQLRMQADTPPPEPVLPSTELEKSNSRGKRA